MTEIEAILRKLSAEPTPRAVLCTLVSVSGSSYRRPGARLLISSDHTRVGSISGGCLEEDLVARADDVLASGRSHVVVYDTTSENDLVWGVGLGCHGVVRVVLERIDSAAPWIATLRENLAADRPTRLAVAFGDNADICTRLNDSTPAAPGPDVFHQEILPPQPLTIFGAGDDAQPLAALAATLGWRITVADPRPAYATPARFPQAARVLVVDPSKPLDAQGVALTPRTAVVIMTHHYIHDTPLLGQLLARPLAYLGLLGPKKRATRILQDLTDQGASFSETDQVRLHAPTGLDLGGDTPAEVALSILAEIQSVLTRRDARPLRQRERPIHS